MTMIYENQYALRASEGIRIGMIDNCDPILEGKWIRSAEFFQIFFYAALATVYILTSAKYISPEIAGYITLAALPFEIVAYYKTMTLYGKTAKHTLTLMAMLALAAMAILSIKGLGGDYAWTTCGGGFLVHTIRNLSEYNDFIDKREKDEVEFPRPICSKCQQQIGE